MRNAPIQTLAIWLALAMSAAALIVTLRGNATSEPAAEAAAPASSFSAEQTEDIGKIARAYIVDNPEVIREAIQALQNKEELAKADLQAKVLLEKKDAIFADPASPVAGNPVGDVTVVEFFDYKCPYCKQVTPAIEALLKEDKGLKLVFKEFPILGDPSVLAARAALAAAKQGKYVEFHAAMMAYRGALDLNSIAGVAANVGLDGQKLVADMESEDIVKQLTATHELALALQIRSTPTFIVGDKLVPGALSIEELKNLITDARNGS